MYEKRQMEQILELHRGYDLPERARCEGTVPIISSSGCSGYHNQYKCNGENVITGRYGTIGEVFYYEGKCWPLNTALYVSDFKENCPRYIYYLLKYVLKSTIDGKDKSTVPGVDRNVLHQMYIPYCQEVQEQKKIIGILESIDKKIQVNDKINDNLQQQIKLLYDYWFTQFDFPDENGKPYKSSNGRLLYNDKVSHQIPEAWTVCNLIENPLTSIIKPGVDVFDTKKYLATADVIGTNISIGTKIEYVTRESRANMQPTVNSVWFAKMKNSIKHLYLNEEMKTLIDNCILSTGFCGIQCSKESFEYVASFIEHSYFETIKNILAHGATQEAVNNNDITKIPFVIPSAKILRLFHEKTQSIYSQISKNICENQELTKLRDWLLPMLMNGQATLSD